MKRMFIAGKTYILINKRELHRAFKNVSLFSEFISKINNLANGDPVNLLVERGDNEKR